MRFDELVKEIARVGGEAGFPSLTLEIYVDDQLGLVPQGMHCATIAIGLEAAPEEEGDDSDVVEGILSQL